MARSFANPLCAHPLIWARDFTPGEIAAAIGRAAACGFDMVIVPLRDTRTLDVDDMRRRCEAAGIAPRPTAMMDATADVSSPDAAIRARGRERLMRAVAQARDLGASMLGGVLHGPLVRADRAPAPDALRHAADSLAAAAEAGAAAGVRLATEAVNRYESPLANSAAEIVALAALTGRDDVQVHLDSYHMNIEETDEVAALRLAAPLLGYFEFSESNRGHLGAGRVDVDALARGLAGIGYRGPIGLEAFSAVRLDPQVASLFGVWRGGHADGDDFARRAIARIDAGFAAAAAGTPRGAVRT